MAPFVPVYTGMDTIVWLMLLASGRHPGEPARSWADVQAIHDGQKAVWRDPGAVERLDFGYGSGGKELAPEPPFEFLKEDTSGTTRKIQVRDGRGRTWQVRFGAKAAPDVFVSRLAWALGYYTEPNYFVREGTVRGVHDLRRARRDVAKDGSFGAARFQLRSSHPEFLKSVSWAWNDNPFRGTPQFQGLKILAMLVSEWDGKDLHQAAKLGSNTGIYRDGNHYLFFVDDWGRSMGLWGSRLHRSTWDAGDYFLQSKRFITQVHDGRVSFGWRGENRREIDSDITVADIRWLLRYLNRITDEQIRVGLRSSGATPDETDLYLRGLHIRIHELDVAARGKNADSKALVAAAR
jgi:hypothetical protein